MHVLSLFVITECAVVCLALQLSTQAAPIKECLMIMTESKCNSWLGRDISVKYYKPVRWGHSFVEKEFRGIVVGFRKGGCQLVKENTKKTKTVPLDSIINSVENHTPQKWQAICEKDKIVFVEYLLKSCDPNVTNKDFTECYRMNLASIVGNASPSADGCTVTGSGLPTLIAWNEVKDMLSKQKLLEFLAQNSGLTLATLEDLKPIKSFFNHDVLLEDSLKDMPPLDKHARINKDNLADQAETAKNTVAGLFEKTTKRKELDQEVTDARAEIIRQLAILNALIAEAKGQLAKISADRTLSGIDPDDMPALETYAKCVDAGIRAKKVHVTFELWLVAKRSGNEQLVINVLAMGILAVVLPVPVVVLCGFPGSLIACLATLTAVTMIIASPITAVTYRRNRQKYAECRKAAEANDAELQKTSGIVTASQTIIKSLPFCV